MTLEKLNLPPVKDFEFIRNEAFRYIEKYPFSHNQVALNDTGKKEDFDPYEGTGSLYDYELRKARAREKDFSRWAPELEGSELSRALQRLSESGFNLGRTRFMRLLSRGCSSFHKDTTKRLHLVLQTNVHAIMIFPPSQCFHIPSNGHFYLADTTKAHGVMNGGMEERIHLVIALQEID